MIGLPVPIVDASVVVDLVAPDADPQGPSWQVFRRLAASEVLVVAPRLMWAEVADALLSGVRRGRWDGTAADAAYELLAQLPVTRVDVDSDLNHAWDLARRFDEHPVYDMLYVALAERRGDVLITADERLLARVGGHRPVIGVEDWTPGVE